MRISLPKFILTAAALAAVALTANTAMAEKHLKVPFDFTVDGQTWPAGMYLIEKEPCGSFITLKSADARKSLSFIARPGEANPGDHRVVLEFDHNGDQHVLRDVQYDALTSPRFDKEQKRAEMGTARLSQGR